VNPEVKFFQVRDRGTNISVMCVRFYATALDGLPGVIARRVGWGSEPGTFYLKLSGTDNVGCSEWTHWSDRTNRAAHAYISREWMGLKSGDVVDVEFILEESEAPKGFEA